MPIRDLLPRKFRRIPAFDDLMDALEQVSNENIWDPAQHIIDLRSPDLIDDKFLSLLGGLLGFNLRANMLTTERFRRTLKDLVQYYFVSGTNYFGAWLGYIEGGSSSVQLLWSNDYRRFIKRIPDNAGTIYAGDGDYFITPHVVLYLSAGLHFNLEEVQHMFYLFAPVPLVLDSIEVPLQGEGTPMNILLYATPKIVYL